MVASTPRVVASVPAPKRKSVRPTVRATANYKKPSSQLSSTIFNQSPVAMNQSTKVISSILERSKFLPTEPSCNTGWKRYQYK